MGKKKSKTKTLENIEANIKKLKTGVRNKSIKVSKKGKNKPSVDSDQTEQLQGTILGNKN